MFHKLVSNAVEYDDGREPRIEVGSRSPLPSDPDGGDPARAVVHVRDNGIGNPAEARERVFDLFQRLDTGDHREGSGAGLAIVRGIVEREGGRVWLESEPGRGTTFYLSLPRARAGPARSGTEPRRTEVGFE